MAVVARRGFFSKIGETLLHASGAIKPPVREFRDKRMIPYSPDHMFSLVSDVNKYKAFVPYCTESKVLFTKSIKNGEKDSISEADLTIGFGAFSEKYRSIVHCLYPTPEKNQLDYVVRARAKDTSIFEVLETEWRLGPVAGHAMETDVRFLVRFSFKSALHQRAADVVFQEVCESMVQAFAERARVLYCNKKIS